VYMTSRFLEELVVVVRLCYSHTNIWLVEALCGKTILAMTRGVLLTKTYLHRATTWSRVMINHRIM
jgi:hypothetical protein